MRRIELEGTKVGKWNIIEYLGNKKYLCVCDCGTERIVSAQRLLNNTSRSCGCDNSYRLKYDLTGQQINEWKVLEYEGNQMWKCKCSCGNIRSIHSRHLRTGESKSCGHNKVFKDLNGQTFGEWVVLEYIGNSQWRCRCSCGKEACVNSYDLTSGKTKSCGHKFNKVRDLTGQHIGEWEVVKYAGNNRWTCRCSCGEIRDVLTQTLVNGESRSCGHDNIAEDISGQRFWNWTAIKHIGYGRWLCRCDCGTEQEMYISRLKSGESKSCGCLKTSNYIQTVQSKYGVKNISQRHLSSAQIEMTSSRDELYKVICGIKELGLEATPVRLSEILGLTASQTMRIVRKYSLEQMITLGAETSRFEDEILGIYPGAERSNRKLLKGKEIDLYYEKYKLGLEFNGDYWHNEHVKPIHYHQAKTALAYKAGIELMHIFEYEWINQDMRSKLIRLLNKKMGIGIQSKIGARECDIKQVNADESREFLDKYHLQSYASSSITLGLYSGDTLFGVMSFGKSRFDDNMEYELIRLAWHPDYIVIGGTEKLFKHFISTYNPKSIVTYCDISKFTGKSYLRLGFNPIELTTPNYKWINEIDHSVLTRYQTTKRKLIDAGLGTEDETEAEIMHRLGYYRVYDCGNIKFIWTKEKSDKEV